MNKGALWNTIQKTFNVQIEHPVHFSRQQSRVERIQRLRAAPHDSGPMWVANPLSYDFCIRYTSPV